MKNNDLLAVNKPSRLPANVFWMSVVSFFTDFASSLAVPLIPVFIVLVLNQGVDKLGLVLAITTLISYALRFIGGILSDRYNMSKPFLILGYGLSAFSKPFLGLVDSWTSIAALRSSERLGKAIRSAPKDKLLTLSTSKETMGRSLGKYKAIEKTGEFLGLLSLIAIISVLGFSESTIRNVLLISVIPGVFALIVLVLFVKDQTAKVNSKKKAFSLRLESKLRGPILSYTVVSACLFGEAFFLLLGTEKGFSFTTVLSIFALTRVAQILLSSRIGQCIDRYSICTMLFFGYSLSVMSLILLCSTFSYSYALAFIVFGVADIILLSSIRAFIGVHAEDKGASFGSLYFVIAVASAIGSYAIGSIWQHFDALTAIYASLVGVGVSGAICAYSVWYQKQRI